MEKLKSTPSLLLLLAFLAVPSLAHAHTGAGASTGFLHGFGHPFGGIDHLCAMLAVGLWAAQMGGRAIWAVPLSFVSVMAAGGVLGMLGISLPLVESGILLSVLILGVLIAAAVRLPLSASIVLVGLFALFHGHAHGAEMPGTASGVPYAGGFVLATIVLHLCGLGLGIGFQKSAPAGFVRLAGAAIALCGIGLWLV